MKAFSLACIYVLLLILAALGFHRANSGTVAARRLAIFDIFHNTFNLVMAPIALGLFLLVITARVPIEARDGLFGGAGGLVAGALVLNFFASAVHLGLRNRSSRATHSSALTPQAEGSPTRES